VKLFPNLPMMKNLYVIITLLILSNFLVNAQNQNNPISGLRYNDNFNFIKTDSVKKGFDKLKHIPLGKNSTISFGGELREQYQYFENQNFGDVPPTFEKVSVGQLWHRAMAHTNIEIGNKWRVFVQLNSTYRFFNPNPYTEIDEDRFSIHQAFVDYNFTPNWQFRVGRQEMGYGNNRLLTFREGPNTRLTFNAAIIKYKNDTRKIDFLALTPVNNRQFAFDEVSFKEYIFGVYATENIIPQKLLLDYYYLHFLSEKRTYNYASGEENRQSFGFRAFSQNKSINYELETTIQTGKFGNQDIFAYSISADLNYKLNQKNNTIVGVSSNYISGDKNKNDNQLNTYNLLFSKPAYGLAAPIGSSNIVNVNPYFKINPLAKLYVYAGVYFLNRQSNQDGTYTPGMVQVRPTPANLFASSAKNIGTQYALETSYTLNKNIAFFVDYAYFAKGNYIEETGKGKNIQYFSVKSAFKF
jgi:Alginate export